MSTHNIFYYPYSSFKDDQSPILKIAAIYFDKLFLLDPEKSSSGMVGIQDAAVAKDIALLGHENVGILEKIAPEDVVEKYESAISKAILDDMRDEDFFRHCQTSGKKEWTIALAKIPKEIRQDKKFQPKDKAMQRLLGEVPGNVASGITRYSEVYAERAGSYYSEVYDENVYGAKEIEFRYADYPVELGESIMLNHALFAGLLYSDAIPLTDDDFHHKALEIKIKRIRQIPELAKVLDNMQLADKIRHGFLAQRIITDRQLQLPIIKPDQPLEKILEYREKNKDLLNATREKLAWLSREIRQAPWTGEFDEEIHRDIIPKQIRPMLQENQKARNGWLKKAGLGIAAVAATAQLFLNPMPFLSLPMFVGIMAVAGENVIPGVDEIIDLQKEKRSKSQNGLQYLLKYKADN